MISHYTKPIKKKEQRMEAEEKEIPQFVKYMRDDMGPRVSEKRKN